MTQYKLMYFHSRQRAEITRLLFALAGVEYEDIRVHEEWPELKKKVPFGYLPVLEVDGTMIGGSMAITRFVAKRLGLAGSDDIEEAVVDSHVLITYDLGNETMDLYNEDDETKKPELRKRFKEDILPNIFTKFENILSSSSSGYLISDKLTVADVALFDLLTWLRVPVVVALVDEDIAAYPKIMEHERKIHNLPKISAWISKRPKTIY